jgi:lysine-specific permease
MIALGGSVGTGIFLTSGYSIFIGGAGGALTAYLIMAVIVFFLMRSLGEMSVFRPSSGSLCDYANSYVNSSFGFAIGYNYWFCWVVTITTEISAATIVLSYWFPNINYISVSLITFAVIFLFNLFSVRIYGEIEYWLSLIKIIVIVIFIVFGIYYYLAHYAIEATQLISMHKISHLPTSPIIYNTHQHPIFHQGIVGILSVLIFAGFSFQGIELVGVASGEAKHPEQTIPKAISNVFWRLSSFYILSILIIALLTKHNTALTGQSSVAISPYTMVFSAFIGQYAANLVNLIIFIALISTANASMYTATRILWYLSKVNHAHPKLTRLNRHDIPLNALLISTLCGLIFFACSLIQHGEIFTFLVAASSLSGFISWFGISYSHYCFRTRYLSSEQQNNLVFRAKLFPYAPIICMIAIVIIIGSQFITLKANYNWLDFMLVYSSLILFIGLYLLHQLYSKIRVNR